MRDDDNSKKSENDFSLEDQQKDNLLDDTWLEGLQGRHKRGLSQALLESTSISSAQRVLRGPTAIYVRYSPRPNEAEASVERQIENCFAYLDGIGAPRPDPSRIFVDRMASGASTANRPAYEDMLADLDAGGHTLAVGESDDRFTREMAELARVHKLYEYHGAELHFADRGKLNPSMIGVHGFLSMQQRRVVRARTMKGRRQAAEEGRWVSGRAPYAFRTIQGSGGVLVIFAEEAKVVTRAALEFAGGASIHGIVHRFNHEKIPSPSGGLWNATTLTIILRRTLNVGIMIFGMTTQEIDPVTGRNVVRDVPKSEWIVVEKPELAILERELFDAVQERLTAEYSSERGARVRHDRLLSGLVFCPCGSRLRRTVGNALACDSYIAHGLCSAEAGASRKGEYVDRDVLRMLQDDLVEFGGEEVSQAFSHAFAKAEREDDGLRQELIRQSRQLDRDLDRTFDPDATAGLSAERLVELRQRLEADLTDATRKLAHLDKQERPKALSQDDIAGLRAAFAMMIERAPFEALDENDRDLLQAFRGLVESVEVDLPRYSRSYRIKITLRRRYGNVDGSRRTIERSFKRYRTGFRDDPARSVVAQDAAERGLFALADEDWAAIEHLFADHPFYRLEPRRLVDALLFHAFTGVPITRTPACFGNCTTLRNAGGRIVQAGTWDRLVAILTGSPVVDGLDATVFDHWKLPEAA